MVSGFKSNFRNTVLHAEAMTFLKYIDSSDPREFASENSAVLSQDSDIVLAVKFQNSPVIKALGF
jgi:hypothetical protein